MRFYDINNDTHAPDGRTLFAGKRNFELIIVRRDNLFGAVISLMLLVLSAPENLLLLARAINFFLPAVFFLLWLRCVRALWLAH